MYHRVLLQSRSSHSLQILHNTPLYQGTVIEVGNLQPSILYYRIPMCFKYVRFQVLTAASMMFRIVFWELFHCFNCFICPSQDNSAPPLDPSSLPDHIGTIPVSTEALLRAELHPLYIILPHSFFYFEPPTHCHWPFPSLSFLTPTGHPGPGLLYNRDPFVLGSLIPDDGGSMHL
jgi:hypothetical protein